MLWKSDLDPELAQFFSKKEAPLDYILDSFPTLVVIEDLEFNIIAVNNVAESLLGYKPSELLGKPAQYFYDNPADFEARKTKDFFGDADSDSVTFETRYQKTGGGFLEAETMLKKMKNNKGEVVCYLGVVRDISKRKQFSRRIEKFYSLPLNLMCTASPDGYFREINDYFEEVLGFTKEKFLSMSFSDLIHPEDIELTRKKIENLVAGEQDITISFENRFLRKDGSYHWLAWTLTFDKRSECLQRFRNIYLIPMTAPKGPAQAKKAGPDWDCCCVKNS